MGDTKLQRDARHRAREVGRAIGRELRTLREDAGLTITSVAAAAGIDRRFLSRIETGDRGSSLETLATVLAVLGADLSVKAYPTTGPRIRDRIQAAMVEAILRVLHPRWTASPEVPVWRPARGVVDLVVSNTDGPMVIASEFQSELRRLEQQVRWHREKELSLPSADLWRFVAPHDEATVTSRLLVLRSTRAMRDLANAYEATLRAAYPARAADVVEALTGDRPWPGPGIAWMRVDGPRAALLDGPPRGVALGR
ncbi:MAG: helix-turn-helix transcriptional regulator [Candidatus Limnocylindrales bacterium]